MSVIAFQSKRDVVTVSESGSESYLHSQLSQDIAGMVIGSSVLSLLLDPTGRVDALVRVTRVAQETFEVDVDSGFGDQVLARLTRFKIRVKAELVLESRDCLSLRSDAEFDAPVGVDVRPAWWMNGKSFDVFGADSLAGFSVADANAAESCRVRSGWPQMGREVTDAVLPAELGVTGVAVSFKKGCYPGQELVERMDSRGARAPRVLCRVPASTSIEGVEITSVAGDVALAFVKRSIDAASISAFPVGPDLG